MTVSKQALDEVLAAFRRAAEELRTVRLEYTGARHEALKQLADDWWDGGAAVDGWIERTHVHLVRAR
jgi:hypothetical protein